MLFVDLYSSSVSPAGIYWVGVKEQSVPLVCSTITYQEDNILTNEKIEMS